MRGHEPIAAAHDRRHDDPQISAKDPTRLYPHHQGFCFIPRPVARHSEFRGQADSVKPMVRGTKATPASLFVV
jgi:hypothetical protein